MSTKKVIVPARHANLLKNTGKDDVLQATAVADSSGTVKVTVKAAHRLSCTVQQFLRALEKEFGLCAGYAVTHAKTRATYFDWEFTFPPSSPARDSAWLKKWLLDNSAGIYRPCADAAARIETLEKQRYLLAQLAAPTPQFFNPLDAMAAKALREAVLKNPTH